MTLKTRKLVAENSSLEYIINYNIFKYKTVTLNGYFTISFYCISDQINSALVRIK